MRTFKDYYYSNRRLQLQSDMALPSRFLETYQPFCAQACLHFPAETLLLPLSNLPLSGDIPR